MSELDRVENNENSIFLQKVRKYHDNFIKQLNYQNKSINTINTYNNVLKSFIEYLSLINTLKSFKEIKTSLIYDFFEYKEYSMNKQGDLSANTKLLIIRVLRLYFSYIEDEDEELLDFSNLFKKIKIKAKKREPKGLSEEELNKLLNQIEVEKSRDGATFITFRNSLIIKLMLFAGLRISEVLNLKHQDFSYDEDKKLFEIRIISGKGDKDRISYAPEEDIFDELEEIKQNSPQNGKNYIFVSKAGKKLTRENMDLTIKGFCKRAGIKLYSAHNMRHTFAKNFLKNNGNITYLQKLLGHSNINTTMIYADPFSEDVKNGYSNTMSKELSSN